MLFLGPIHLKTRSDFNLNCDLNKVQIQLSNKAVEFVKISAHGALLLWKKKDVLSHNWLLAAMVRQPQMAIMSGDEFYIDVDPIALRFIYSVLQGIVQASDFQNLTNMEVILIKNTAEYLLCPHVAKIIEFTEKKEEIANTANKRVNRALILIKQKNNKILESIKNKVDALKEENRKLRANLKFKEDAKSHKKINMKNENIKRRPIKIAESEKEIYLLKDECLRLKEVIASQEILKMRNGQLHRDLALMMKKNLILERKVRGSGSDKDHKKGIAERWNY